MRTIKNSVLHILSIIPLLIIWIAVFTSVSADNSPEQAKYILVEHYWEDGSDNDGIRPSKVSYSLLADGKPYGKRTCTAEDGWRCAFTNLPIYNREGELIQYEVTEEAIPGYHVQMIPTHSIVSFIDTHIPDTIDLPLQVFWNDGIDQDALRPESLDVQLLADHMPYGKPVRITSDEGWIHQFHNLPRKKNGKLISYRLKELNKPAGYTISHGEYNHKSLYITCTHESSTPVSDDRSEMTSFAGIVQWYDLENSDHLRPESMTLSLYGNDRLIATATVSSEENWTFGFDALPLFGGGTRIYYKIKAESPEHYRTAINGSAIRCYLTGS